MEEKNKEGCEVQCCGVSADEYWTKRFKEVIGKKLVRITKGNFPGTAWSLEFENGDVLRITTLIDVSPYGIEPVTSLGIGHIYREKGFSLECEKKNSE